MTGTTALRARFVLALAIGSALEFYDFSVFSQLGEFIGPNFFPKSNPVAIQLSFWASYGVAFIVRPLGALAFGHVGDRHSRKNSLVWSLLLMAAPTALMGCIPSFSVISWAAPVLLVLLRLVQGFAVGGENGMSIVYLFEAAPPAHRNLVVALGWSGIPFGVSAGIAVVLTLTAACSRQAMELWGWRVAMLIGALTGAIGILLRRTMPDPAVFLDVKRQVDEELEREATGLHDHFGPEHDLVTAGSVRILSSHRHSHALPVGSGGGGSVPALKAKDGDVDQLRRQVGASGTQPHDKHDEQGQQKQHAQHKQRRVLYFPALAMLRRHWSSVMLQFVWELWMAAGFYAYSSLWPTLMAAHVPGANKIYALGVSIGALLLMMPAAWLFGWLCDKGLHRMKTAAIIYLLAAASAAPAALLAPRSLALAAFWQWWAVALTGALGGILAPAMCPLYPTEVRASGFSLAHQLAMGPVGGLTPLVVSASALRLGPFGATAPWLAACAAVSLVTSVWLTLRRPELDRDLPEDHQGCEKKQQQGLQLT